MLEIVNLLLYASCKTFDQNQNIPMNKIIAVTISILIVVIPLGILYYLISYGIVQLFGKETYAIIIFTLALFFLVQGGLKRLNIKK